MKSATNGTSETPDGRGKRFALVVARFYAEIAGDLVDGAKRALRACGARDDDVTAYDVPGCFEIPLACRNLIDLNRFDALVALGAVVRGETPHFDFIAGQCASGIMQIQLATGIPIGFGVLTTNDLAQAQERADPKRGDKGYQAAIAAVTLLRVTSSENRAGFRQ